ncbi:MAG: hypothetical protein IPP13_23820 [Kouleothrix sp.]|nr:hypothetical protein [Kouleothrix sp.]
MATHRLFQQASSKIRAMEQEDLGPVRFGEVHDDDKRPVGRRNQGVRRRSIQG